MTRRIVKAGLCVLRGERVLLARSADDAHFQIPGGKIEHGESDLDALVREAREELDIRVHRATAVHMETFEAAAAGRPDVVVEVRLYRADFEGEPRPSGEIAEIHWQKLDAPAVPCSDVVREHILPYLAQSGQTRNDTR